MASRSSPSKINIKPEYCREALIEWYRLAKLGDHKESFHKKDLVLKAKQHLLFLGWKVQYINKKYRWKMCYTSPTNGKHYFTLRRACKNCIKDEGYSVNQLSTTLQASPTNLISSTTLPSKKRPRALEETDESNFNKDYEASISNPVKKPIMITTSTSEENEKHGCQSESKFTDLVGNNGRREKVINMSVMEKNSESHGKRGKVLNMSTRERYTLVSWLINNQVLIPNTKVSCRGRNNIVKRGSLSFDGIVCDCCQVIFTITKFEAHAGCTRHRPSTSIMLDDGRSFLECQRDALSLRDQKKDRFVVEENVKQENDSVCSICGLGGNIILCDRCPSSFHIYCLNLDQVPDGDWFCPSCCCKICHQPKSKQECYDLNDNNILVCVQCEQNYHFGCVNNEGIGLWKMDRNAKNKNWFCSVVCGNIFLNLNKLLGKSIKVADNLTWTLMKNTSIVVDDDEGDNDKEFISKEFSQKESKLNAALGVLYESFDPTIDASSGRELIKDVVFSRGSKQRRLNFRGFCNVILEKKGEVISVATIRIHGQKVAEIVFVATKEQYRGHGMCRMLMNELEEQLSRLEVESLILHSSEEAINTWTKSFGFVTITGEDKRRFINHTFLEFQNTIMCLKYLK
ncbi:unnamed protein product [Lathyrus sativus]|nr:unnamed protein product [Lathyrus sativus]